MSGVRGYLLKFLRGQDKAHIFLFLGMHSKSSPFSENYCRQYWQPLASKEKKSILKCLWHQICFLHFLVDSCVLKLEINDPSKVRFGGQKVSPLSAAKTIMLHSCDVQSYENTSATLVRKGGIEKKGWMYCVTGEPNDVSYKNNTLIPGISVHYFPKDVAICPKWTRFDRRYDLRYRRLHPAYRLWRRLLPTHITNQIRGRQPMNSAEKTAN